MQATPARSNARTDVSKATANISYISKASTKNLVIAGKFISCFKVLVFKLLPSYFVVFS